MYFFETLYQSLSAIMVMVVGIVGFIIISAAMITMVQARKIEWGTIIGICVILVGGLAGFKYYPPALMGATTESLNRMADEGPRFNQALQRLWGGVVNPWHEYGGGTAVPTIYAPTPAPTIPLFFPETPTAVPAPPVVVPPVPTATQLAPLPTLPVEAKPTAVPTLDMSLWNVKTPAPTPNPGGN